MRCRPLCVARGQLLQRCPPRRWACASRATNVVWQRLDGQGYAPQKHDLHQYDSYYVNLLSRPCPSIANTERCAYGYWLRSCSPCWWLGISFHTTPRHGTVVLGQRRPCQVGGRRGDQRHLHCEGHGHGLPSVPAFQRSAATPHPLCFCHASALAFGDLACRAAASTTSQAPTTRACSPFFH